MKLLFTLFALISIQCYSQDFVKQAAFSVERQLDENREPVDVTVKVKDSYSPGNLKNLPAAVKSHFKSNFPGAKDLTVFVDGDFRTLSFSYNGKTTIVKYKNNGVPVFVRKTYAGDKLDKVVVDFLKEEVAADYKVKYITEVVQDGNTNYNINFSNDKNWLVVKITDNGTGRELQVTGRQLYSTIAQH